MVRLGLDGYHVTNKDSGGFCEKDSGIISSVFHTIQPVVRFLQKIRHKKPGVPGHVQEKIYRGLCLQDRRTDGIVVPAPRPGR